MICLSDNDLILKLAICDLLDQAMGALETTPEEVYVLPTASYVLLRPVKDPDQAKARLGAAVYERLRSFLASVQTLSRAPSADEQRLFDDAVGIDSGEAILFSATAHFEEFLLATSDKRSLRALCDTPACAAVRQRLTGRVICFEQVIRQTIDKIGFEAVRAKVLPASHCDTALRAVFGSGLEATEENVQAGLSAYIADLRKDTKDLLVPA